MKTPKVLMVIGVLLFFTAVAVTTEESSLGVVLGCVSGIIFLTGMSMWLYGITRNYREERKKIVWEVEPRFKIAEVKLLSGGSTEFKRGGLKGALIGGFFGGGIGAAVGAVTRNGKAVDKQRFAVKYQDGHVEIKECDVGSQKYKTLMGYVKWEDIK